MLVCQQVLYTGDFSCVEDRHLMAAEAPPVIPDILISVRSLSLSLPLPPPHMLLMPYYQEATYGTHVHELREVREARFTCEYTLNKV